MDKKLFIVRQKNYDVGTLIIDDEGECYYGKVLNPDRVPFMRTDDERRLISWWRYRGIPENRQKLAELLKEQGCSTPQELLLKNWGLSLTDTYWICPEEYKELKYEDVNLFDHGNDKMILHDGYGRIHYTGSANAATGGTLDKRAVKKDNEWYLEKKFNTEYKDGQQNVNEMFISYMHELQGYKEYTPYTVHIVHDKNETVCDKSICRFFTSKDIELITADLLTQQCYYSRDSVDETEEVLKKYIDLCSINGLDPEYVQNSIDYMLLMDYITTNADRHWSNFGILRNPDTLKYTSMAPIYDNGNSMFYNTSDKLSRLSLIRLEDNGITRMEFKRLALIKNRNLIKTDLLPSPSEVKDFYEKYGISEERAKIISESYSNKLDLFLEYVQGLTINISREWEGYYDGPPYINQTPNAMYFDKHPEELTPAIKKELEQVETNSEEKQKSEKLIDPKECIRNAKEESEKKNSRHKSQTDRSSQITI